MPQASQLYTSTVTTGVLADTLALEVLSVLGFATRFESTFDECRIVKATVRIRPISASSGVTKFWFDEKSNATPTANEGVERYSQTLVNSNANCAAVTVMTWRPHDLLDLQFNAIATATTPVFFKLYTDNAIFGAPAAATALWLIEPMLTIEFRGLKST
jgi:hypothetical protein